MKNKKTRKKRKCKVTGKMLPVFFAGYTKPEYDNIMDTPTPTSMHLYEKIYRHKKQSEAGWDF
tara:strand:+ start:1155 stop:1343 length:189 start_codon:yes stop_codon:yes gene_type:complete